MINTPFAPVLEHFLEPSFELVTQARATRVCVPCGSWRRCRSRRRWPASCTPDVATWRAEAPPEEAGPRWQLVEQGFRVDDLYGAALVVPGRKAAEALAFYVDAEVVDGAVNGVGRVVQGVSSLIRPLQTGFARSYALGILLGTVGLVVWLLARGVAW